MWRARPPDPGQIELLRAARERHRPVPAGDSRELPGQPCFTRPGDSRQIDRRLSAVKWSAPLAIGAEYLVLHPGSYRDHTVEEGIAAFVLGMQEAARGSRTPAGLTVLLENTVGAGCHLGARFEQLHVIRDLARELTDLPIGYCLDTCHLLAAGFDIATPEGLAATLRAADEHLGLANVHVIHANDSKAPLGSRIDRHANIGEGHIGADAFRRILRHPSLRDKPFILETPVDNPGDDRRNLDTLKALAASRPPRLLR